MITDSILNIAHSLISSNINILYGPSNTILDNIIKEIDGFNIFIHNDIVQNYYYDMYIANNFLLHTNTTKNFSNKLHLKDIIAFHAGPPQNFKKEDVAIMFKAINKSHKIFFGQDVANSWKIPLDNKISIVEYGIPLVEYISNRNKNILIFNPENNPQIDALHKNISSQISDTDIINDIAQLSISDLVSLLSSYKIFIDFGSKINVLFAISCGTQCITPINLNNEPMCYQIKDFNLVFNIISNILNQNLSDETRRNLSQKICSDYDYEAFKNNLVQILDNIKNKEIFIL